MNEQTIKLDKEKLLEEFKTLRDETLKRIELSYAILNLTFIAVGGLWSVAIASGKYDVFLFYPSLSLLFTLGFVGNGVVTADIGHYIREVLEEDIYELRWAEFFHSRGRASWIISNLFVLGIFFGGSVFSLILFFILANKTPGFSMTSINWLLTFGLISTILTFIIVIFGAFYGVSDNKIAELMRKINNRKTKRLT